MVMGVFSHIFPWNLFLVGDNMAITYDAVVVGGGMAGLTTAYRLASLKQKVALCDAWEVGGRTKSIEIDGDKVSVGGE